MPHLRPEQLRAPALSPPRRLGRLQAEQDFDLDSVQWPSFCRWSWEAELEGGREAEWANLNSSFTS